MRPHRQSHLIWSAILAAALGAVAVPSATRADSDEPTPPADDVDAAPDQAAASPGSEPAAPSTTAPPTTERPTPDTTAVEPPVAEPTEADETAPPSTPPDASTTTTTPSPEPIPVTITDATPPTGADHDTADPSETAPTSPVASTPVDEDELDDDSGRALPDGVVRPISFPVLGPMRYANDWGNCRDGCSRRHLGTDLIGVRMQPLLAAVDGTVTRIRHENVGTAGSVITVTGVDGWRYNYFHVNNDTPGTDDAGAGHEWQISPQVSLGSSVRAGQVIAYMGDSGNAEVSVPHLHFEIRQPDGTPVNPHPSLVAAQKRQTCAPDEAHVSLAANAATLSADAVAIIAIDGVGRWLIDDDGTLVAEGSAALVTPVAGIECDATQGPTEVAEHPAEVVEPVEVAAEPVAAVVESPVPGPVAPADMPWTVERGQSLWRITQAAYGVSDESATVSLTNAVFDNNRDQLTDPDVLNVGMTLLLPPIAR